MTIKTIHLFGLLGIVSLLTLSCEEKHENNQLEVNTTNAEKIDHHTSQNALDWVGTYSGMLPCADCEGIDYELTLNENNTFEMKIHYLVEEPNEDILEGNFSWSKEGTIIHLDNIEEGIRQFKVEENQIRVLDSEGNIIDSPLAGYYILTKE